MDIIKLFYQRIRVKQMLHVFIQAQIRKFEYIPFIETNTLVQNSFNKHILETAVKTLDHISHDMCSPYKKRKTYDNSKCKIKNLQKYSVYLLKNRNKTNLNNDKPENSQDSSLSKSTNDLSEFKSKVVNIGDLIQEQKYSVQAPNIFKGDFAEYKSQFIDDMLSFVMKTDFNTEDFFYLDQDQTAQQEGQIDYIKRDIREAVTKANNEEDSEQAYKSLMKDIVDIAKTYYQEFKTKNFDIKVLQNTFFDAFTNSEINLKVP